jgi:hypothetical protein
MSQPSANYRPDIDGLRAVAVTGVVLFHAFPDAVPGGFTGVDVFFVISGFLISGIILDALHARRFSYRDFYARRIRRIFPALIVVLAAVLAAGWFVLFADDYLELGRHVAAGAAFGANFMLWYETGYFDAAAETKPLQHLWSLGIEEQFYLAWPALLVASARWRPGRRSLGGVGRGPLALTLTLLAASFVISIVMVGRDPVAAFYAPWARFWELLLGGVLACVTADPALARAHAALLDRPHVANLMSTYGAVLIVAAVSVIDEQRAFPGWWACLPAVGTFLMLAAGTRAWINRTLLSLRPVVWVGLISYPLYLWHWPALVFARLIVAGTPPELVRGLIIAASVLLSWLTYRVIERPARFGPYRVAAVAGSAAAMVLACAAGLAVVAAQGFGGRNVSLDDEGALVQYYEKMRTGGMAAAYRAECDFMDWRTSRVRPALDPSCTQAGEAGTILVWGDSFAQALAAGLREQVPAGVALAQVATSGCLVALDDGPAQRPDGRCERANAFALETIRRLRPGWVILTQQSERYDATPWPEVAARIVALGAARVLIVGPAPVWRPSLPVVYGRHFLAERPMHVALGLDRSVFASDRRLAASLAAVPGATYVSLIERLCGEDGCLARVPGERDVDLMAFDYAHLTPKGSAYVAREILTPYLE